MAPGPHVEEVWFTGMHSDVGWTRQPDQDLLSSVPLKWILDAVSADLIFREKAYQKYCSVTEDHALGRINKTGRLWSLAGTRRRSRPPGAVLHSSVNIRRRHFLDYLPGDFPGQQWSDPNWTVPTR